MGREGNLTSAPRLRWYGASDHGYVPFMITLPPVSELERAWQTRDASYDGLFVIGVRTTGIFCRPTCPARKPLPRNVEYFRTPREALAAGYRPCRRCRPLERSDEPAWVTELLRRLDEHPGVRLRRDDFGALGVDPATVRRHFQRVYGMTFQAFARARRLAAAMTLIREGGRVGDAVHSSGFESHGGFGAAVERVLGSSPGRAAATGCILLSWIRTPLGPMVAGATEEGVCLLEFTDRRQLEGQLEPLRRRLGRPMVPGRNEHLVELEAQLARYFDGQLRTFTIPVVARGTPFQEEVWSALREIPYGVTTTYEDLARTIGRPLAVRAVGRANGMNRIAIVIPCHRVVNKDGQVGGYGGGRRRKEWLLGLEGEGRAALDDSKRNRVESDEIAVVFE